MMTNDMRLQVYGRTPPLPEAGWLSGFLAGIEAVGRRDPDWMWAPFMDEMNNLIVTLGVEKSTPPGEQPPIGTPLAALGGYMSAAGEVDDYSLRCLIPFLSGVNIKRLLQLEGLEIKGNEIRIPISHIDQLLEHVTIEGPVLELLEERMTQNE